MPLVATVFAALLGSAVALPHHLHHQAPPKGRIAAGSPGAVAADELFACVGGQCVPNPAGIPLSLCQLACAPLAQNFTCASDGQCEPSSSGIPKADCEKICLAPGPPPPANIVDLALSVPDLSTLVTALKAGSDDALDLIGALSGEGPFTVFAPTNAAFAALPPQEFRRLLDPANIRDLQALLTFHVATGRVLSGDLTDQQKIFMLDGKPVKVTLRPGQVFIDRALVVNPDNEASNGVVHIIDEVLVLPPSPPPPPPGPMNIVQLAQSVPTLSTLVTAVVEAQLADTLSNEGPFTVFAPNNQAFNQLPSGELQRLLRPENIGELQSVLTLHVVAGRIFSDELKDGQKVTTLNGEELSFIVRNGIVLVFSGGTVSSQVVAADNVATNGVVHIVTKVLLPGDEESQ